MVYLYAKFLMLILWGRQLQAMATSRSCMRLCVTLKILAHAFMENENYMFMTFAVVLCPWKLANDLIPAALFCPKQALTVSVLEYSIPVILIRLSISQLPLFYIHAESQSQFSKLDILHALSNHQEWRCTWVFSWMS